MLEDFLFWVQHRKAENQGKRPKADGVLGQQAPSPQKEGLENAVSSLSRVLNFWAEPRQPKGFPPFSAFRMASPDTIITGLLLIIVDYRAAIEGKTPVPPCVRPWIRVTATIEGGSWLARVCGVW